MPTAMIRTGTAVDFMPTARPLMIVVAEPVWDCLAISLTKR